MDVESLEKENDRGLESLAERVGLLKAVRMFPTWYAAMHTMRCRTPLLDLDCHAVMQVHVTKTAFLYLPSVCMTAGHTGHQRGGRHAPHHP